MAQYHPHLHVLATRGGYDGQGARWEHLQYLPYELLRRKWQWHLLTMLRQTLKTEAIHAVGGCLFQAVSQRPGDQRAKGASPLAVSECGALCGASMWSARRSPSGASIATMAHGSRTITAPTAPTGWSTKPSRSTRLLAGWCSTRCPKDFKRIRY